jgi:hypothetical protein
VLDLGPWLATIEWGIQGFWFLKDDTAVFQANPRRTAANLLSHWPAHA